MPAFNRLYWLFGAGAVACAPTVQQEVNLGNKYVEEIDSTMPVVKDPAVQAALDRVVLPIKRVAKRQDLAWTYRVINSDQVNAFAVPGGHIYVFRGLIERTQHYDELVGVLGHETGHVDLRHSAEQMGEQTAANLGLGLTYLLLGRKPGVVEQVALGAAAGVVFAKFSRDDEREADSIAVEYLTRAGVNPRGLTRMFEILQSLSQKQPAKVEQWFSSHPMTGERIANVNRVIATTPGATQALRTGAVDRDEFGDLQRLMRALPPPPKPKGTR